MTAATSVLFFMTAHMLCRDKLQEQFVDLQALVDYVEVNRTGFRKALKKHDKVLGPLGHAKLMPSYFPKVEGSFPEKNRLRVQVMSQTF